MPEVSEKNREKARLLVKENLISARKMLPDSFKAMDPQRIARALEVFFETGKHITDWQKLPRQGAINPTPHKILINPSSDVLRKRIADRIPKMLAGGAIEEAKKIIKFGWNESRAIGAAQLCSFLRGEVSQDECVKNWITKTNQYAKRQKTWFRIQFVPDEEIKNIY